MYRQLIFSDGQKRWNPVILIATVTFALLILSANLLGQTNQGSIAGNVLDPSGAVVAGAHLTATDKNTGSAYETVSSGAGSYRFSNEKVGNDDVSMSATGFKETT